MKLNQVICGDCLEVMKDIPDKSIDMILCDLPYGTTACKWDTIIPFEPLWEQYKRIIKDNGAIVLTASQPFTSALVMSNPKMFKYEWIWDKVIGGNIFNCKKMPLKAHENCLVFYKNTPTYNPQMVERDITKYRKKSKETISPISNQKLLNNGTFGNKLKYPTTILTCNRSCGELNMANSKIEVHPTQKPVALFEYLIKTYTNEGDLVLDNCAGSGTTAIACLNTNRNYILIEKEPKYIEIINNRINNLPNRLSL